MGVPRDFRCPDCGKGTVRPVKKEGRTWPYKKVMVPVPADLAIRTCDNCGVEYTNASEAAVLDAALEIAYQAAVKS